MPSSDIFAPGLFAGRRALVTGGGTGIGFAIARELGRLGAAVTIAARDLARLEKAAVSLRAHGIDTEARALNIRKDDEVVALFESLQQAGRLPDILINNAGGQFAADPLAITPNGFRAVVDLNLQGTWHVTRLRGTRHCRGHFRVDRQYRAVDPERLGDDDALRRRPRRG